MARAGHIGLEPSSDDDLIEISSSRAVGLPNGLEALLLPQPIAPSTFHRPTRPALQRRRMEHHQTHLPSPRPSLSNQNSSAVIDLTEEPDSPVEHRSTPQFILPPIHLPNPAGGIQRPPPGRNPRRTNSIRITPPRLARSESIILASQTSFIDLTGDDDNEVPEQSRRSLRNNHLPRLRADDHLIELEILQHRHRQNNRNISNLARTFGQTLADLLGTTNLPGGLSIHSFGSMAVPPVFPEQREPSKPPMEPIPDARAGFTRDTCLAPESADEKVIICPACEGELAYDPTEPTQETTASKKRKRAPGEHHFWALKKCGHVSLSLFLHERERKKKKKHVGYSWGFLHSIG